MIKDNLFGLGNSIVSFSDVSAVIGAYPFNTDKKYYVTFTLLLDAKVFKKTKEYSLFQHARVKLLDLNVPAVLIHEQARINFKERSSKGIKSIQITYDFNDPYLAYALGLNLSQRGINKVNFNELPNWNAKYKFAEKMILKAKTSRMELVERSKIFGVGDKEKADTIWKEKCLPEWMKISENLKKNGLDYLSFNNK